MDAASNIAGTASTSTSASAASATSETKAKGAAAAADFETFLKLLTTQMQNQDPLKPLESTEFVAQLAQFSAVEQQIGSNTRLDAILESLGGGSSAGLADWIGKEVQAAAETRFGGDALEISVEPEAEATRAVLVVTDENGTERARLSVDPAAERLSWAGETGAGDAPHGLYAFSVEYLDEERFVGESEGLVFSRVAELRLGGDAPMLRLESGTEIPADAVRAVREPQEG